jgi:hypothetical protein
LIPVLLLIVCLASRAAAADYSPPLEEGGEIKPRLSTMIEGGAAFSIGSDLGLLPQLGCYRDLPHSWQAGLQARVHPRDAKAGYDYLPQIGLNVRKLWLGDEDGEPIRNSEYFGLALGGFFAYDFEGARAGLKPFGTLSLGKYWMPFDNQPFGLDLNLDLTRYISGHLPGRSELVFITLGVNFFYVLP